MSKKFDPQMAIETAPKCSECGEPMNWITWPESIGGERSFYCDRIGCDKWMDMIPE